jgi:hypothetical protein
MSGMLTGNESLDDLYNKKTEFESEIEKLHGSERKEKESHVQDIDKAIDKLKKKSTDDDVKY